MRSKTLKSEDLACRSLALSWSWLPALFFANQCSSSARTAIQFQVISSLIKICQMIFIHVRRLWLWTNNFLKSSQMQTFQQLCGSFSKQQSFWFTGQPHISSSINMHRETYQLTSDKKKQRWLLTVLQFPTLCQMVHWTEETQMPLSLGREGPNCSKSFTNEKNKRNKKLLSSNRKSHCLTSCTTKKMKMIFFKTKNNLSLLWKTSDWLLLRGRRHKTKVRRKEV